VLFALGIATGFCWIFGVAVLATSKDEAGPTAVGMGATFAACALAFAAGHFFQ
jgi:hypothetical protein